MKSIRILLSCILVFAMRPAFACGWWGDGEMIRAPDRDDNISFSSASSTYSIEPRFSEIPGGRGFSIAILDAGRVVPYLALTHGQKNTRIADFKPFGFTAVIDLGAGQEAARKHGVETVAAGMGYFNIAVTNNMPSPAQVDRFAQAVVAASNAPLLVYAPTAESLAAIWVAYRLSLGAPLEYILAEGRMMGLKPKQEMELMKRMP